MKEENTQLKFYKTILEKVSFDSDLFEKEFNKAIVDLSIEDSKELKLWKRQFVFDRMKNNFLRKTS